MNIQYRLLNFVSYDLVYVFFILLFSELSVDSNLDFHFRVSISHLSFSISTLLFSIRPLAFPMSHFKDSILHAFFSMFHILFSVSLVLLSRCHMLFPSPIYSFLLFVYSFPIALCSFPCLLSPFLPVVCSFPTEQGREQLRPAPGLTAFTGHRALPAEPPCPLKFRTLLIPAF